MSEKQPKKKKTAGDVVLTVVLIAAICVFCYAGYNLFHIYTEYKKGTDEYNSITQMAVTERDPDGEAAGPEAGSELKAPMDIDFASLKSVNDDVVGWIYVEAVPDPVPGNSSLSGNPLPAFSCGSHHPPPGFLMYPFDPLRFSSLFSETVFTFYLYCFPSIVKIHDCSAPLQPQRKIRENRPQQQILSFIWLL